MKVLLLTATAARHDAMALALRRGLSGAELRVVREAKGSRPRIPAARRRRPWRHRLAWWWNTAWRRAFPREWPRFQAARREAEEQWFGEASRVWHAEHAGADWFATERGTSLNDRRYVERLAEARPDVLVAMGCGLLGRKILSLPRLGALNLHAGLSPWYRGGYTNLWPLVHREPELCGATVHRLTPGIDAGEIAFHVRPDLAEEDTFGSLNCKALELGAAAMVSAVEQLLAGELRTTPQWTTGRLYHSVHLHAGVLRRYHRLLDGGQLRRDLARARKAASPEGLIPWPAST